MNVRKSFTIVASRAAAVAAPATSLGLSHEPTGGQFTLGQNGGYSGW
jgi:hypothetical protein